MDLRELVNGPLYVLGTCCPWRAIPKDLPPRSTLHGYFMRWEWDGTFELIHRRLYVLCREQAGRGSGHCAGRSTAAIIDSQSVKSAEKGGLRSTRTATMGPERSRTRSATSLSTSSA